MPKPKNNFQNFVITLRGMLTLLWVFISTGIYSPICIVLCLFSKKAGYAVGKLWSQQILAIGGVKVKVSGLENLNPYQKYAVIGNHQSNLDIQSLISIAPLYLYFMAKKELFNIPFLGWGLRALGHFPIDRRNARRTFETFSLATQRLRKKNYMSLVIFPEGTRSPDGKLGEFKKGSFTVVLDAGMPILPVIIRRSNEVLPKTSLLVRPGEISITFLKPIDIAPYQPNAKAELSQFVRETIRQKLEPAIQE
jgi:1-acyl-sn-glycerol-3-phosphate acyltransferase